MTPQSDIQVRSGRDFFPRSLRPKERDALQFVLPSDSTGYRRYRVLVDTMIVLAEGRRGKGNFVLGRAGDRADITSPLAPVVAYGAIETTRGTFTITVREEVGEQIDVEIVSGSGEEIPDHYEEKQRWTYSSWRPGLASPASQTPVREVRVNDTVTFAVASADKRLWVHDAGTSMNHLIPITNFYNELMLLRQIRDPRIALQSALFFQKLPEYSDADLRSALVAYNRVRKKVDLPAEEPHVEKRGLFAFLGKFGRKNRP